MRLAFKVTSVLASAPSFLLLDIHKEVLLRTKDLCAWRRQPCGLTVDVVVCRTGGRPQVHTRGPRPSPLPLLFLHLPALEGEGGEEKTAPCFVLTLIGPSVSRKNARDILLSQRGAGRSRRRLSPSSSLVWPAAAAPASSSSSTV